LLRGTPHITKSALWDKFASFGSHTHVLTLFAMASLTSSPNLTGVARRRDTFTYSLGPFSNITAVYWTADRFFPAVIVARVADTTLPLE